MQRFYALFVNLLLVHARSVIIANQALGGFWRSRGGMSGSLLENAAQDVLGGLAGRPASAPYHHRRRYGIVRAPIAVRKVVEILAWTRFAIHVVDVDSVQGLVLRAQCRSATHYCQSNMQKFHENLVWTLYNSAEKTTYEARK